MLYKKTELSQQHTFSIFTAGPLIIAHIFEKKNYDYEDLQGCPPRILDTMARILESGLTLNLYSTKPGLTSICTLISITKTRLSQGLVQD